METRIQEKSCWYVLSILALMYPIYLISQRDSCNIAGSNTNSAALINLQFIIVKVNCVD